MNIGEAKKYVSAWLWESPKRETVNREWDNQYITDAAQMLMEAHCKIEQLEVADKALKAENARLAALRDTKTEELRDLLRKSLAGLERSCTKPMQLILDIRQHLRLLPTSPAMLPAQALAGKVVAVEPYAPEDPKSAIALLQADLESLWQRRDFTGYVIRVDRFIHQQLALSHAPATASPHNPAQK